MMCLPKCWQAIEWNHFQVRITAGIIFNEMLDMSMPFMNQFMGMAMGMGMENLLPLLATQKLTTEGFMEMHKLQANNGRNFAEKTNPSANSVPIKRDPAGNDKRQDVSEKLMNREQQQGGKKFFVRRALRLTLLLFY